MENTVAFVGSAGVGKTSIIRVMCGCYDAADVRPTVSVDFQELTVNVDSIDVTLHIRDTAGQDAFQNMVPLHVRGAGAVVFVFSVDSDSSFADLRGFLELVSNSAPRECRLFVAAHKCDLDSEIEDGAAEEFCKEIGAEYFETSVQQPDTVKYLLDAVARALIAANAEGSADAERAPKTELVQAPARKNRCC